MNKRKAITQFKYLLRIISLFFIIPNLTACNPSPSPEARERARVVLEETSPRNMNDHPKVTCPNVGYTFPDGDCKGRAEIYNQRLCDDDDD